MKEKLIITEIPIWRSWVIDGSIILPAIVDGIQAEIKNENVNNNAIKVAIRTLVIILPLFRIM